MPTASILIIALTVFALCAYALILALADRRARLYARIIEACLIAGICFLATYAIGHA